jgi:hypothetical protein
MRSFENVDGDNVEECQQSDECELGFQHMTHQDIVNAATKQEGEEDGGKNESAEGQSSECISHSMVLKCAGSDSVRIQ